MKPFSLENIFYNFKKNIRQIFSPHNLIWHLLAIVLTYAIVKSDLDWKYYLAFNNSRFGIYALLPALIGFAVPILAPLALYLWSLATSNKRMANISYALTQAEALGWLISSFYKFFTGRVPPPRHVSLMDISHHFQFGFYRGGIFWGWPSSHTAVAFAASIALITLFPKNHAVKILALLYAFYIGIGVSISIHWFSEFVAGAIIGSVIGIVVGKSFRQRI